MEDGKTIRRLFSLNRVRVLRGQEFKISVACLKGEEEENSY